MIGRAGPIQMHRLIYRGWNSIVSHYTPPQSSPGCGGPDLQYREGIRISKGVSRGKGGVTFTAVLNRLHFGAGGIDVSTPNGKPTIDSMTYITCNMRLYDTPLVK